MKVTQESFNSIAAYGIWFTFSASIAAVIVSIFSMLLSKKISEQTNLRSITLGRKELITVLRESSSNYFTQIAKLCGGVEKNLLETLIELTRSHVTIVLVISKKHKEVHAYMNEILKKANEIVWCDDQIRQQHLKYKENPYITPRYVENLDIVIRAREQIRELQYSIIYEYRDNVFADIQDRLELEWSRQLDEAGFWSWLKRKNKKSKKFHPRNTN